MLVPILLLSLALPIPQSPMKILVFEPDSATESQETAPNHDLLGGVEFTTQNIRPSTNPWGGMSLDYPKSQSPGVVTIQYLDTKTGWVGCAAGTLVDPQIVLTSARVVHAAKHDTWNQVLSVTVPKEISGSPAKVVKMATPEAWVQQGKLKDALGVLILDRPLLYESLFDRTYATEFGYNLDHQWLPNWRNAMAGPSDCGTAGMTFEQIKDFEAIGSTYKGKVSVSPAGGENRFLGGPVYRYLPVVEPDDDSRVELSPFTSIFPFTIYSQRGHVFGVVHETKVLTPFESMIQVTPVSPGIFWWIRDQALFLRSNVGYDLVPLHVNAMEVGTNGWFLKECLPSQEVELTVTVVNFSRGKSPGLEEKEKYPGGWVRFDAYLSEDPHIDRSDQFLSDHRIELPDIGTMNSVDVEFDVKLPADLKNGKFAYLGVMLTPLQDFVVLENPNTVRSQNSLVYRGLDGRTRVQGASSRTVGDWAPKPDFDPDNDGGKWQIPHRIRTYEATLSQSGGETRPYPGDQEWLYVKWHGFQLQSTVPNAPYKLYRSANPAGSLFMNQIFELGPPVEEVSVGSILHSAGTDASGNASFHITLTPDLIGRTLYYEAAIFTGGGLVTTNRLKLTVTEAE
ncbi:MAG: hypothetical protein DWQ01_21895 [Planctomycetota bacterium]|nr:MAG: hypothetical protein DWQ01_21895 [Planctomycetota bacterium]